MLQINFIRDNKEEVIKRLAIKNFKDAESIITNAIKIDAERRNAQKESDDVKAEANGLAKQVGELMKSGKKEEAETVKAKTADLKLKEKQIDEVLKTKEEEIQTLLVQVL